MKRLTAIVSGVLATAAVFFVPKLGYAETPSKGCEILPEGFIVCELPAAQKPWIVPLTPDCAIIREDEYSLTLRCRINVGQEPKWVPGPKPVLNFPKPKPTKKVKKKRKR
jgi:hypothetical protein